MSDALPLSSLLASRLGGSASPELEDTLVALHRAGQQAWPEVPLSTQDFMVHLAERLGAKDAGDRELSLDKILAGDLYLACACARHVPQALSVFDSAYLSGVPVMVGHLDSSPAFQSEVAQAVRVILFLGSDGQSPIIGQYDGRGALHSFVRIVALRAALKLRRRRVTDGVVMDDPDRVDELPELALGAELAHIKDRYRPVFKEALHAALGGLPSQERNLLRLQAVVGLSGKQIASMYRVSEATMSRRLAAARAAVLEQVQRLLKEQLRLSPSEVLSLAGVLHSQLDLSLSRVLGADQEE